MGGKYRKVTGFQGGRRKRGQKQTKKKNKKEKFFVFVLEKRAHRWARCLLKAVVDAKVPFSLHYGHYQNDDDQQEHRHYHNHRHDEVHHGGAMWYVSLSRTFAINNATI